MKTLALLLPLILAATGCCRQEENEREALLRSLPDPKEQSLDEAMASRFARLSLACVDREYPNKPANILDGDDTVLPPRKLTPVFSGCFDWHSAAHGHWALVRLLRLMPSLPEAGTIRAVLDRHLTAEGLAAELAYFQAPRNKLFERPYGWGWLLRLSAELEDFDDPDARRWYQTLRPLSSSLASRSLDYLNTLSVAERSGTHQNTAFSMVHMLDYAKAVDDRILAEGLRKRARDFFGSDVGCPTDYEPSGEDFLSPCLTEAGLMARVLSPAEYLPWLERFLPSPGSMRFRPLAGPPEVKDLEDPRIGHLIGLSLQRAWCFREIASALGESHPWRGLFSRLERVHRERALDQMFGSGYGGEHWLSSFAVYLLTPAGG